LVILGIDDFEASRFQYLLLLIVVLLLVRNVDEFVHKARLELHLIDLTVQHQPLVQQLQSLCLQLWASDRRNQVEYLRGFLGAHEDVAEDHCHHQS
jgi:hypothetical protein